MVGYETRSLFPKIEDFEEAKRKTLLSPQMRKLPNNASVQLYRSSCPWGVFLHGLKGLSVENEGLFIPYVEEACPTSTTPSIIVQTHHRLQLS